MFRPVLLKISLSLSLSLVPPLSVCVSVCAHAYVCAHMCVYVCVHGVKVGMCPQRTTSSINPNLPSCFRKGLLLFATLCAWLAGPQTFRDSSVSLCLSFCWRSSEPADTSSGASSSVGSRVLSLVESSCFPSSLVHFLSFETDSFESVDQIQE